MLWQRKQFEDAGQRIAEQFVTSDGSQSINNLVVKVAQDNNLSPDGIRTLVRIANTCAFQELFTKAAGKEDRMIEFETGDPELVISTLHSQVKEAVFKPSSNYNFHNDYFGDLDNQKIAEDTYKDRRETPHYQGENPKSSESDVDVYIEGQEAPLIDKARVKKLFEDAKIKMDEETKKAEFGWASEMEKAAQTFRVSFGKLDKKIFCKEAIAECGTDILPELKGLNYLTGNILNTDFSQEKLADCKEHYLSNPSETTRNIFNFLKVARNFRTTQEEWKKTRNWLETKMTQ
jgi:hypothetical protein